MRLQSCLYVHKRENIPLRPRWGSRTDGVKERISTIEYECCWLELLRRTRDLSNQSACMVTSEWGKVHTLQHVKYNPEEATKFRFTDCFGLDIVTDLTNIYFLVHSSFFSVAIFLPEWGIFRKRTHLLSLHFRLLHLLPQVLITAPHSAGCRGT